MSIPLTSHQQAVLDRAQRQSVFLEGPPGSGKTTIGVAHMRQLLRSGVAGAGVLVLLPQRTLARPYYDALNESEFHEGSMPAVVTYGGLTRRMLSLFWPLIAQNAGFANPHHPPVFLTLETAQYYAASLLQPLLDQEGYFETVTINRNRIYTQVLDNMNKAAVTGIPLESIGERLQSAWVGDRDQLRVYAEVQTSANLFRDYCLHNNLLDYSLQVETFNKHLWPSWIFRRYFYSQYRYLIYDNIEEDVPVVHEIVAEWSEHMAGCLFIYDHHGGYRLFLGADPISGLRLRDRCTEPILLHDSLVQSPSIISLQDGLSRAILKTSPSPGGAGASLSLQVSTHSYYPEMIDWIAGEIQSLTAHGVTPGEIAVLTPFLSDSLRFEFSVRFESLQLPLQTHRPSRSLKDEPATRCLLTLLKLVHPEWKIPPSPFEFRSMLMQAITGFDLVRADILSKIVYRLPRREWLPGSFDELKPAVQQRVTYAIGERYETLRQFILSYRDQPELPLDIQVSTLFSELLAQPSFGFHGNFDAAETTARLIDSFRSFKSVYVLAAGETEKDISRHYVEMIEQGVLAAQFLDAWDVPQPQSVFLAPAYTFLMANRPVEYQFWLDIGSLGWWERLNQPLTHPYVLSRHWSPGEKWTDQFEYEHNQHILERLVRGLLYRCRRQVTMCITDVNEHGLEQRGPLLKAVQAMIRTASIDAWSDPDDHV